MRCTQLLDGEGATELVTLLVGFAFEDDALADVDELLGVGSVEVVEELLVDSGDDVELPAPSVLPPEEQPATTNPVTTQALTARTSWREAGTARR